MNILNKKKKDTKTKGQKNILTQSDKQEFKIKLEDSNLKTTPMGTILRGALDEETRRIVDISKHRDVNDVSKSMVIKGNKGKVRITDIISKQLGDKYSELTKFNSYGFGTSRFIKQSKINKFIEYNLPKLSTSLNLFVDDVCNGSNFGNEEDYNVMYKFYRNGVEITEEDQIKKMESILEPDDLDMLSTDIKKCSQIDREGFYVARRDGAGFIRVIPNSKIAKDMYIKYVLKEAKIRYSMERLKDETLDDISVIPKDKESSNSINKFLKSIGLESITEHTDISTMLSKDIVEVIPKHLTKTVPCKRFATDIEGYDKYNVDEFNKSETFYSFCKRYLSGDINKVYAFETEYSINKFDPNTKTEFEEKYEAEPMFTYTVGAINSVDGESIIKDIFGNNTESDCFALESLEEEVSNSVGVLDDFQKEIINKSNFEDIYNLNIGKLLSKKSDITMSYYSTESMGINNNSSDSGNYGTLNTLELVAYNVLKNVMTVDELNNSFSMEAEVAGSKPLEGSGLSNIADKKTRDMERSTEAAEEEQRRYSKLDKMFANVKGETIEFIENQNVHPVMGGDRLMGIFNSELTTDDIQNLMLARNMIYQGSAGAGLSYNNVEVDDIDLDQTIGKLMFTDYIKPIIEKTISKDFIRQNADIGHVLLRLMEANDMSNITRDGAEAGSSMYNYTKVNFIPADELIFYRNGTRGLGTSVFQKAEIPAHMCILLREEYLGWMISEGKGVSFITIPQGSSEITGEAGMAPLMDQLDEFMSLDRTTLRNTLTTNVSLTHKFFRYIKPNEATQDINVQSLEMPEFKIDQEMMLQLEQEASEIVGYNCAMFSSRDGNVELARKLFEMNGTKVLEIITSQYHKRKSTSQLATALLRIRGGEEYNDVIAVWVPPTPSKVNIDQKVDGITSKMELLNKFIEVVDTVYEGANDKADYELVRKELLLDYIKNIFAGDKLFADIDEVYNKKTKDVKVNLSTVAKEKK